MMVFVFNEKFICLILTTICKNSMLSFNYISKVKWNKKVCTCKICVILI